MTVPGGPRRDGSGRAGTGEAWTVDDAAQLLDPPMSSDQVKALITACALLPVGERRTGRRGRGERVYSAGDIRRAHAAIARFIVLAETRQAS